jgi:hypothetical protein
VVWPSWFIFAAVKSEASSCLSLVFFSLSWLNPVPGWSFVSFFLGAG